MRVVITDDFPKTLFNPDFTLVESGSARHSSCQLSPLSPYLSPPKIGVFPAGVASFLLACDSKDTAVSAANWRGKSIGAQRNGSTLPLRRCLIGFKLCRPMRARISKLPTNGTIRRGGVHDNNTA
jgi:hypothetical protein